MWGEVHVWGRRRRRWRRLVVNPQTGNPEKEELPMGKKKGKGQKERKIA